MTLGKGDESRAIRLVIQDERYLTVIQLAMRGENMFRKAKILFNWLTGYNFSDPRRNGEHRFLRQYLRNGMVVFDVGANIGEHTAYMLSLAKMEIHCFEPVAATFELLQQRHGHNPQVRLNSFGLSDIESIGHMKIFGEAFGINSLYDRRSAVAAQPAYAHFVEQAVTLRTIDNYMIEQELDHIDFLKIDVEGHELKVLQGAIESLASGRVAAIQFEYGSSFVDAQASLKSIYDLVTSFGFRVYRLLPYGMWPLRSFDPVWGLENYQHSNWVALR